MRMGAKAEPCKQRQQMLRLFHINYAYIKIELIEDEIHRGDSSLFENDECTRVSEFVLMPEENLNFGPNGARVLYIYGSG